MVTHNPDICWNSQFADYVTVSSVQNSINDISHNVTYIHRHGVLESVTISSSVIINIIITCSIPSWWKGRGPLESSIFRAVLWTSPTESGKLNRGTYSIYFFRLNMRTHVTNLTLWPLVGVWCSGGWPRNIPRRCSPSPGSPGARCCSHPVLNFFKIKTFIINIIRYSIH